jgi:hypothetical protein
MLPAQELVLKSTAFVLLKRANQDPLEHINSMFVRGCVLYLNNRKLVQGVQSDPLQLPENCLLFPEPADPRLHTKVRLVYTVLLKLVADVLG